MKAKRLLFLIALVAGCKANQDPLDDYLVLLKHDVEVEISELDPVLNVHASRYTSHQVRQPFELPKEALLISRKATEKKCWQPKPRFQSGQFEQFSLNQLHVKGMLSRDGRASALIAAPNGEIRQVNLGQYLGANKGKVTRVTEQHIVVEETLPDGLGCWQVRDSKLALK